MPSLWLCNGYMCGVEKWSTYSHNILLSSLKFHAPPTSDISSAAACILSLCPKPLFDLKPSVISHVRVYDNWMPSIVEYHMTCIMPTSCSHVHIEPLFVHTESKGLLLLSRSNQSLTGSGCSHVMFRCILVPLSLSQCVCVCVCVCVCPFIITLICWSSFLILFGVWVATTGS